jgi:hypothetical protein
MLKKHLIPLGLAAALGASTTATALDLDTTPAAAVTTYATDSFLAAAIIAGTGDNVGTNFNTLTNANNLHDVTGTAGVGFAENDQVWIRIDLTNGAFTTAATAAELEIAGVDADTVTSGGQVGTSYAVWTQTVGVNTVSQANAITWTPPTSIGYSSGTLGVTVTSYSTVSDSLNQTNPLVSKSGSLATGITALTLTSAAANEQAKVATLFTAFDDAGTVFTADLGSLLTGVTAGNVYDAAGTDVAVADITDTDAVTSIATISGDFSFGTWSIDTVNTCATGTALTAEGGSPTLDAALSTATVSANFFDAAGFLCVTVDALAGEVIPIAGPYTASVAYAAATGSASAASVKTGSFGAISHNGTTVELPYLTTFEDYNQRLVIVNRGSTDADYSVTFTSEAAATATAGAAATGTVAAGTTASIKVSDIVTMEGLTRTAGTIVIVAPEASISVATNQVNLEDGSTDTVVLL